MEWHEEGGRAAPGPQSCQQRAGNVPATCRWCRWWRGGVGANEARPSQPVETWMGRTLRLGGHPRAGDGVEGRAPPHLNPWTPEACVVFVKGAGDFVESLLFPT
jgi:hypothetical protein